MASNGNFQGLLESLKKNPLNRTTKDILGISSVIREYFESLDLETIKYLSSFAHYVSFEKSIILFNVNDQADCWFILLTGKILLKGKEYHAPCSFGKIYDGQIRRTYKCMTIEYCQLMKIFHPSMIQVAALEDMMDTSTHQSGFESLDCNANRNNNNKIADDSSDDDEDDDEDNFQESFLEFDLSDLTNESFVSITVKDVVQECLEKSPDQRNGHDVNILRDFMLHFNNQVFNSFQKDVQDLICRKFSYVVVEKEGTVVLGEGEDLKFWAFVTKGCLEVIHTINESNNKLVHMGDSFGIDPSDEYLMKSPYTVLTKVPSCHFISLVKEDWTFIRNKEGRCVEKETIEDGKKVLVVEEREIKKGGRKGYFVKKGTSEQLIKFLIDDRSTEDPTYVEDFLLTSRVFLREGMSSLTDHLMLWFNSGGRLRDKSVRIVLLWVNNHFEDFEADYALSHFLMSFMQSMQTNGMSGQLELLYRACCAQAKLRKVTMERSSLSQPWGFNLVQGKESGKVFVDTTTLVLSQHTADKKRTDLLIRGDHILEINGKTTSAMTNKNMVELINKSSRVDLRVKCNFVEHSEALSLRSRNIFPKQSCSQEESEKGKKKSEWSTRKLFSNVIEPFIKKINIFGQNALTPSSLSPSNSRHLVTGSNPDLSSVSRHPEINSTHSQISPADILNVYLVNQLKPISLAAGRSQNVHHLVKMALKSSGLNGDASSYSLFEVTFKDDKVMKYSRIPDCSSDLQSRTRNDVRIYLINNSLVETNWVNELNLNGGSQGHALLWHLKPQDVATELCLRDFQMFRNIQSTEYLHHLFKNAAESDDTNLGKFSKLANEEMFWVATEICSEVSLDNRVKLIQFFLKVVQHCLEMNNFNSTFAILSGLRHNSLAKLKQTWKRVPTKYMKLFENLQDLMDPSNNMSKYRSLLSVRLAQSPAIPFFPMVMKDLTFIDLGNKTFIDGMINYEKMRMIAKQISSVTNMASPFYHNKSLESQAASNVDVTSSNVAAFATIRKKKTPNIISTQLKSEDCVGQAKKYLENLKTIQDEEELRKMSLGLEPTRISSRSKSEYLSQNLTKSSQDSKILTPFKFGSDSPHSHQKLMTLTEKISRQPHSSGIQEGGRKRPSALSVSSYDTLTLTMRKGIEPFNPFKKGCEVLTKRRDAVLLSLPTCSPKVIKPVRLTAESSSVSAPIRYNPSVSISKALFAITNQKPFNMTLRLHTEKSSVSSSAERLDDLFVHPLLESQSTPVSPCRAVLILNPSSSGSTPKIPAPRSSFNDINSVKPDGSNLNFVQNSSRPIERDKGRGVDSGRGVSLDGDNSKDKGKGASPREDDNGKKKRRSLTRQRKETSLDLPFQEFDSLV